MMRGTRWAWLVGVLVLAAATPALAQSQLAATWTSADWGTIELHADGTGSYTSTYGTGPGRIVLSALGGHRYSGRWSESSQRHGTLTLELAADGRTITGTWTPDPNCTIGTQNGGTIAWTRR